MILIDTIIIIATLQLTDCLIECEISCIIIIKVWFDHLLFFITSCFFFSRSPLKMTQP